MTRSLRRAKRESRAAAVLSVVALVAAGVIGWVSYNALTGLPLQSRRYLSVELPDAQRLLPTSDVRIGGVRVGQVDDVTAEPARGGRAPYARARLALEPAVGEIPVNTTVTVRAASALGATYVQLTLGTARETVPDDGTLPLRAAKSTVSVTDLFDIFDRRATSDFQQAAGGLAAGLAGRGESVNATLRSLAVLMPALTDVSAALASPDARLPQFLTSFATTSSAIAPAGPELAGLVSGGAATFGAIARERTAFGQTLEALPSAELATTDAFVRLTPVLNRLAKLTTELRPAGALLPTAVGTVNATLPPGATALRQLPSLTRPLRDTVAVLRAVSRKRSTTGALRKLGDLMSGAGPVLEALVQQQEYCNTIPLFTQNLSSAIGSLGTEDGPAVGIAGIATSGSSTDQIQAKEAAPNARINNLPVTDASECESNNEPDTPGQVLGNPKGLQPNYTRKTTPPAGVRNLADSVGLTPHPSPRP